MKNVLEMKKTKIGIVVVALLVCVVVAVCFLSNPRSEKMDVVAKENAATSANLEADEQQEKEVLMQTEENTKTAEEQEKEAEQEKETLLQAEESAQATEQATKDAMDQESQKIAEEVPEVNAAYTLVEEVPEESFGMPFKEGVEYSITALFGAEKLLDTEEDTNAVNQDAHNGVDFAAEFGTEVISCTSGTVKEVGFDVDYGNYVVIEDETGFICYYMHLKEYPVKQGQMVSMGSVIGTVGSTGKSTGPHLHLGIQNANSEWIDPASVLGL